MWWSWLALALSCGGWGKPSDGESGDSAADSAFQETSPAAIVDVLVIGSGPAGLSAAWAAQQAGAEILVLELADTVGPTAAYAENYLLAGTQAQRDFGVEDSVDKVRSEWSNFTVDGNSDDPLVQAFTRDLPAMESWFLSLGAIILGPRMDPDAGDTPRLHGVRIGELSPASLLALTLEEWVWTEHRAVDVVQEQGAVVGVQFVDERSGETGWVRAGATVLATGGFARDLALVQAARPEFSQVALLSESHPLSTGAGLELLESAGAGAQNLDSIGIFVHGLADPRAGFEGEVLIVPMLPIGLAVDTSGERVTNEERLLGLHMDALLLKAEGQRIWVLLPEEEWAKMDVVVPSYNSTLSRELADNSELKALGAVQIYPDIQGVAAGLGLAADTLVQGFERYNDMVKSGDDLDYGKNQGLLRPFTGGIAVLEVRPGAAKNFGGARLDVEGRVLDDSLVPIKGLYAAGEVAGMLGTPDIGQGFSGSITAVHWTGLLAGESAAAYLQSP